MLLTCCEVLDLVGGVASGGVEEEEPVVDPPHPADAFALTSLWKHHPCRHCTRYTPLSQYKDP